MVKHMISSLFARTDSKRLKFMDLKNVNAALPKVAGGGWLIAQRSAAIFFARAIIVKIGGFPRDLGSMVASAT